MDAAGFSDRYLVRRLTEEDVPQVYRLCSGNELYYRYYPPFVTEKSILEDMRALPPNTEAEDKYYVGFFDKGKLIAVLDLVDGYPEKQTAWIGFFMTDRSVQNQGVGSGIIETLCGRLAEFGFFRVRLCRVRENPQAARFWQKNGFTDTGYSRSIETGTITESERILQREGETR